MLALTIRKPWMNERAIRVNLTFDLAVIGRYDSHWCHSSLSQE